MMKNGKRFVEDMTGKLCSALDALGVVYHWEGDNRGGGHTSRYIFTRLPIAAKIRVSDHKSPRMEKDAARSRTLILDVNPRALTWEQAIATIEEHIKAKAA